MSKSFGFTGGGATAGKLACRLSGCFTLRFVPVFGAFGIRLFTIDCTTRKIELIASVGAVWKKLIIASSCEILLPPITYRLSSSFQVQPLLGLPEHPACRPRHHHCRRRG